MSSVPSVTCALTYDTTLYPEKRYMPKVRSDLFLPNLPRCDRDAGMEALYEFTMVEPRLGCGDSTDALSEEMWFHSEIRNRTRPTKLMAAPSKFAGHRE